MAWLSVILIVVGLALVLPAGVSPGSAAGRNVRNYALQIVQTRGNSHRGEWRTWFRWTGVVLILAGIAAAFAVRT